MITESMVAVTLFAVLHRNMVVEVGGLFSEFLMNSRPNIGPQSRSPPLQSAVPMIVLVPAVIGLDGGLPCMFVPDV